MPRADVEYRPIPGFPGYRVGDDGSVWGCRYNGVITKNWRLLKPHPNKDGHLVYMLQKDRKPIHRFGHQIVLTAFVGPCPKGLQGCHNNGNPADNRKDNLRWGTPLENAQDCILHGRRPKREKHGRAKLTEEQVAFIKQSPKYYGILAELGRRFGVAPTTIHGIRSGRIWNH